jgi:hypothetical protein
MAEIPVDEGGVIRILSARTRPFVSIDRETGWPCFSPSSSVPGPR